MEFLANTLLKSLVLSGSAILLFAWILILVNIYELIKLAGDVTAAM